MTLALLLAAWLAPSQAAEPPRAFVERLYASYRDPDFSPLAKPEQVFAPALVAAIREDRRLSRDEVGFMDADPLCECQDPGGMRPLVEAVSEPTRGTATVRVTLRFGPADRRDLSLRLVRLAAGWRIADVASTDQPSLLADLRAWNRRKRSGH
ncbi:MAG TPA: DUF3828 domain-containing protein [Allosphingosinicella sp.]|jgi:hypothetical protein